MSALKQIPNDGVTKSFMANEVEYFIEDSLSIDRWIYMNELTVQLGFGVEFQEMQRAWADVIEMGNKQRFSDIVVTAYNMVNGISKIYARQPMILKFCSLFINTKDEDRGTINDDVIAEKIEDWKKEGLGIDGFLEFSLLKVKGLAGSLVNVTQEGFRENDL